MLQCLIDSTQAHIAASCTAWQTAAVLIWLPVKIVSKPYITLMGCDAFRHCIIHLPSVYMECWHCIIFFYKKYATVVVAFIWWDANSSAINPDRLNGLHELENIYKRRTDRRCTCHTYHQRRAKNNNKWNSMSRRLPHADSRNSRLHWYV